MNENEGKLEARITEIVGNPKCKKNNNLISN